MSHQREDLAFDRFCKSGDPRALATVFDATAPELLRVALHLTRDPERADDLLQSTFLTAIERTASFERGRPVLPWLLTILANRLREWHRKDRQRVRPEQREIISSGDVADLVAERELGSICAEALRGMPEPYRHVLLLHLEHGLTPKDIGESLDRQASTVRNQIARGLEILRRSLPSSLPAGAVLTIGSSSLQKNRSIYAPSYSPGGRLIQCTTSTSTATPSGRPSQFGEAMKVAFRIRPVDLSSIIPFFSICTQYETRQFH